MLDSSVEAISQRYVQVTVGPDQAPGARQLKPFYEREIFGRTAMLFEGLPPEALSKFGELRTPSIADLFVAKMQGAAA